MRGFESHSGLLNERAFIWRDGERIIRFADGLLDSAPDLLAEHGWADYHLLTTERALAAAPATLAANAKGVHHVPPGPVNEVSAELFDDVDADHLVALGGGRVIDAAKAIAAVRVARVAAIPTTLSGAELTTIHRLPEGRQAGGLVRPALVIADAEQMVTLPEDRLRASAMNALAHGAEPLYTPFANPVATMATLRGAALISASLDAGPDREAWPLALGSILCAYALDSGLFALHHVVCQTLVRTLRIPHAETNATMLPRTMGAMRARAPQAIEALAEALGTEIDWIEGRIETLGGGPRRLSELGADESGIDAAIEGMLARAELGFTPNPPDGAELRALIESAW
ncbi:MAG TPA: iron-containing alcohol dehydrogenase [Solirubrobacterales bacterium]|nr:iron-containing alcohol dehydrogenase [Solirubrobacterales bacterium]